MGWRESAKKQKINDSYHFYWGTRKAKKLLYAQSLSEFSQWTNKGQIKSFLASLIEYNDYSYDILSGVVYNHIDPYKLP